MVQEETLAEKKDGFGELDVWFINKYLRHEGETLEEARERIWALEKENRALKDRDSMI